MNSRRLIAYFIVMTAMLARGFFPSLVLADTLVSNEVLSRNTNWPARLGPYNILGSVTVPKGVSLNIEAGSALNLSAGNFKVFGAVNINGNAASSVLINQDISSMGFTVQGGSLNIDGAHIFGGNKVIDSYGSSSIAIKNSFLEGSIEYFPVFATISIWDSSSLNMSDTTMKNIKARTGIEVFNGASIALKNNIFQTVGRVETLSIFDTSSSFSTANILANTFIDSAVGIHVFNKAKVYVSGSDLKRMSGSGFLIHNGADVTVVNSNISENAIGIEAYNASSSIENSSIENNSQYGVSVSGGIFSALRNWWGDASGPYHASLNAQGKGNEADGANNIYPWLNQKPKKPSSCCSNVIFIPGLEGSRLYKKQLLSENQLWEPNRNADVKKLFLDNSGTPVDNSIYTRDAILRTNIGAGFLDRDIYKKFTESLDRLVRESSIKDWKAFPYDWRYSPDDILKNGAKTYSAGGKTKTVYLQDMVSSLASTASNKKVIIVAHSYGGLLAKALANKLEKEGKGNLIEKIILVGVPEEGSVEAVAGLLHGDGQELGRGFILKADVSRSMGINMPAAYYLLPSQNLLSWISSPVIHFDSDISGVAELDSFLKNTSSQRPYSRKNTDIQLPAKLNAGLLDKARAGVRALAISSHSDIDFLNIVGTGLKTMKSISYKNYDCQGSVPVLGFAGQFSCGLNHEPTFTDSGDGTVLTGNLEERWGDKLLFNIGAYNSSVHSNFSHTDFISSQPVIDVIRETLLRGVYPPMTSWSGYIGVVPTTEAPEIKTSGYKFRVTKNVSLSAKDSSGNITGASAQKPEDNVVSVYSQIPNSSYSNIGDSSYLLSGVPPQSISISGGGDTGAFSIQAEKIEPISGGATTTKIFSFIDIPVTPETRVEINNIVSATSGPAVMRIDRDGDGIFERSLTSSQGSMQSIFQYIYGVGVFQTGSSTASTTFTVSSTTPNEALQKLRQTIASSTVSLRFRQRYTTRTNPVATYIKKSQNEGAFSYASSTAGSLAKIVKELSRARDRYYRGGMTRAEASFMYFSWADFANVMREIINFKPI